MHLGNRDDGYPVEDPRDFRDVDRSAVGGALKGMIEKYPPISEYLRERYLRQISGSQAGLKEAERLRKIWENLDK
jgi:hypothetical protein